MDVVGGLPTRGLSILVRTLATPYVTDPLLDTIALVGVWLVDLGKPIELRGITSHGVHVLVSAFI